MKLKTDKKQYIRHDGYDNLYVIPYIRGRLVFAELAARAIEEDRFEMVVVDLPFFMNKGGLWERAVKLFPEASSLLIKKDDGLFVKIPFVPNDAACMSLAVVQTMREWGRDVELQFIDDSNVIHYPRESLKQAEIKIHDDYFVFIEGIEKYYNDLLGQLKASWGVLTEDQRALNLHRAGIVSERLAGCLKKGKKTLCICEYRLWWLVQKKLDDAHPGASNYFVHKWKDVEAALVTEDPLELWKRGALDDYPSVVKRFYDRFQTVSFNSFDKLEEIDILIKKHLDHVARERMDSVSIRKAFTFHQFLQNRVSSSLRLTPLIFLHLYDSAHACMGKSFARELIIRFLDYPFSVESLVQDHMSISQNSVLTGTSGFKIPSRTDHPFLYTNSKKYSYDHFSDDPNWFMERKQLFRTVYRTLSRIEEDSLSRDTYFWWETQNDFKFIELACRRVRERLMRANYKETSKKCWGSMGEGIDWKGTIASKAVDDAIYIRTRKSSRHSRKRLNEFTPITFLFTDDLRGHWSMTLLDGNAEYLDYAGGKLGYLDSKMKKSDYVESVFLTYSEREFVHWDHISKYFLSSITLLYTGATIKAQRYNKLIKRPERFVCRTKPFDDPEINTFLLSEIGIAWAVKYTEKEVLVVADPRWQPSSELSEFSRKRNVQINRQPLSVFHPELIGRIRNFYMISTALETHPERDNILKRFVE